MRKSDITGIALLFISAALGFGQWWAQVKGMIEPANAHILLYLAGAFGFVGGGLLIWNAVRRHAIQPATSVFLFETLYWKLGFPGDPQFPLPGERGSPRDTSSDTLLLKVHVQFNITANIMRIESIELNLMGKRIPSNWVSMPVSGTYAKYIYCEIPKWVGAGEHVVKLVAFANGGKWESSPPYMLRFPQQ